MVSLTYIQRQLFLYTLCNLVSLQKGESRGSLSNVIEVISCYGFIKGSVISGVSLQNFSFSEKYDDIKCSKTLTPAENTNLKK